MNTETVESDRFRNMAKAYVQGVRNSDPLEREAIEDGRLSSDDMVDRMEVFYLEKAKANGSKTKDATAFDVEEQVEGFLSFEELQPIVEKIAYEQLKADQIDDLSEKIHLLRNYIVQLIAKVK